MNILALDLATVTGWALKTPDTIRSGSTSFRRRARDHDGQRWVDFRAWLSHVTDGHDVHAVYVEDLVLNPKHGTPPIVMFGAYLGQLQAWACVRRVPVHRVHNATIKKHITGKGNAKKAGVVAAVRALGFRPSDDNEADALALLDYAMNAEGSFTPTAIEVQREAPAREWVSPFDRALDDAPKSIAQLAT